MADKASDLKVKCPKHPLRASMQQISVSDDTAIFVCNSCGHEWEGQKDSQGNWKLSERKKK